MFNSPFLWAVTFMNWMGMVATPVACLVVLAWAMRRFGFPLPFTRPRRRWHLAAWWLILGAIIATGVQSAMSVIPVAIFALAGIAQSVWDASAGSSTSALQTAMSALTLVSSALVALLVGWWLHTVRYLDWTRASGLSPRFGDRVTQVTLCMVALGLMMWPYRVVASALAVTTYAAMLWQPWPIGLGSLPQLPSDPLALVVHTRHVWSSALAFVGYLIAYAAGFAAFVGILRRLHVDRRPMCTGGGRACRAAVLIVGTGALGAGLVMVVGVLAKLAQSLAVSAAIGAGELVGEPGTLSLLPYPEMSYSTNWVLAAVAWQVVPLVICVPIGLALSRSIDWPALGEATGWRPTRAEAALVALSLAAWLAWPLSLLSLALPPVFQ